ncbi:MAG: hypothetical protein J5449_06820 [Oscillospiraceae bacterium]|nr:hypothetical protein [Oscillospiraceae bacterium]
MRPAVRLFFRERNEVPGGEAVRLLLRDAWQIVYGGDMPELAKTPEGKPYFPARPDAFVSLSHTKTHVLVALGGFPVGADIETLRPVRPGAGQRIASDAELLDLGFFPLWTLKESYIKLCGVPLAPRSFRFYTALGRIVPPEQDIAAAVY